MMMIKLFFIIICLIFLSCNISPEYEVVVPVPICFDGEEVCTDNRAYKCFEGIYILMFDCNITDEICITDNNQAFCYE